MNNPLGVSPSKGNQGTTRGKEKSFALGGNRTHDPRGKDFFFTSCGSLIPFARANDQWVSHGVKRSLQKRERTRKECGCFPFV